MPHLVSLEESYDEFPRIEEAFGLRLDESLEPRGPDAVWDEFARLAPRPDEVAVDIGCGEGADAVALATRFGLRVVGVDPVPRHVELGTAAASEAGVADRVSFLLGSAEQTGLDDGSVDMIWTKEALMYADLDLAFREFRRVLRPGGRVFAYQVFTGPRMSDAEAEQFWREGPNARSVRPEDLAAAAGAAGFSTRFRTDIGSEGGEYAQEQRGAGGRRLAHAARLLRDPKRYVAEFGEANYEVMLADCLWHVYRMIGKLYAAAFAFDR